MVLIEELLTIPEECKVNDIIAKDLIFSEGGLKSSDKKIFTNYVKQVRWLYSLKKENVGINHYNGGNKNYSEVEVINIVLKEDKKLARIVDIVMRIIPYPMILVFEFRGKIQLFVSHQSESLVDSSKITLDDVISTNWIKFNEMDEIDRILFKDLQLSNLDYSDFYKFYDSIVQKIIKYNGSKSVGHEVNLSVEEIKRINDKIASLESEIKTKRAAIKKETQFNQQVELNIEIKKLEYEIDKLKEQLV
jgi:hypothetical protein